MNAKTFAKTIEKNQDTPVNPEALRPALEHLMARAKALGADSADAIATHGRSLSIGVRAGALEDIDSSEGRDIGLRVMVGTRQACVSSSDMSFDSLGLLAERAIAMARLAPEDPYCGLPQRGSLARGALAELDLFDPAVPSPEALRGIAQELDDTAKSVAGVSQTDGASASVSSAALFYVSSDGFGSGYRTSRHSRSIAAIAEKDGHMERDYDYDTGRWAEDIKPASAIGQLAAERAVARLGARQVKSGSLPVLFDRRVAGALVGALSGAISGPAIARGTSYLLKSLGQPVFGRGVTITDNPLIKRGQGSRPFDGEGLAPQPCKIIDNGVLTQWLLNTASARQLGLESTAHAFRSIGAPPGVASSNLILQNGTASPSALMADMGEGLWVTDFFGPSLNSNTGDYSVGVSGFKVERGQACYPVSEITVAGNLIDIFKALIPANDLLIDSATAAPSLLLGPMTVAGT